MTKALRKIETVVRPRHDRGVDWGATRYVLARSGTREVWWQPGFRAWGDRINPHCYYSTQLRLVDLTDPVRLNKTLRDGGRLTRPLITEHAAAIDKYLDMSGIAAAIDVRRRYTIEVVESTIDESEDEPVPHVPWATKIGAMGAIYMAVGEVGFIHAFLAVMNRESDMRWQLKGTRRRKAATKTAKTVVFRPKGARGI